ncbi:hypothetical protein B0H19DRAFT_1263858 [Mycena capillaripes]|nr:hypothetical protein B0H19DRAFT_1263858 [Mycena capillaripes]
MSEDTVSLLSIFTSFVPEGFWIVFVVPGLAATVYILQLALPTRMMRSLEKSLYDVGTFYNNTFEIPRFSRAVEDSKEDMMLAQRLVALEDKADQLRIQTLFHGTFFVQWGELWGLFTGHSFAIWRCTRKVQCLGNEMKIMSMKQQEKLHDINTELAVELSPAWQLAIRHRYYGRSPNYPAGPFKGYTSV